MRTTDALREQLTNDLFSLLAAWLKNGQMLDNWVIAERPDGFLVYAGLLERDSLNNQFSNQWVGEALETLEQNGVILEVSVLGPTPELEPPCECESRSAFILFTHFLCHESPLRCSDCFQPVPLYRIPHLESEAYEDILGWARDYRACDTLQMGTQTGERFGEQQMYRHESSLSRRGRELCRKITLATGLKAYYHLYKYRGRKASEELQRRCPVCGGEWLLEERLHIFDFRCDRCMLLSNIAPDAA